MAKVNIVSGDFTNTIWNYKNEKFVNGHHEVEEIPITEITKMIIKGASEDTLYVSFNTSTNQLFMASMDKKTYTQIYDDFVRLGNNITNGITLPIKRKTSKDTLNTIIGGIIIIFFVSHFINRDEDSSTDSDKGGNKAQVNCIVALDNAAKYGSDFIGNDLILPYDDGVRYRVVFDAKIKNAFGTWGKSRVACIVNGDKVTKLVVDGNEVY